jgi:hypothetical protein
MKDAVSRQQASIKYIATLIVMAVICSVLKDKNGICG